MPDLLVKLYKLPDTGARIDKLRKEGIHVRRAMAYEKHRVVQWVKDNFGQGWAGECDVAFSNRPVSCFIATENAGMIGFACYECTARNFFGPMGVAGNARNRGVGSALLLSALDAMLHMGYAYAIIGGTDSAEYYRRVVEVVEIPGSSPGIYRDRLG
ncbi:MAG: GNAT family N-acetyltransferase [Deferribacteres bacterium]|nr:GNAT family N-acetyltransferase [Deferribacteres bacterium]